MPLASSPCSLGLYLFSMDFLEQLAFVEDTDAFGKAMKSLELEDAPTAVQAWLKDSSAEKKILKMLTAAYQTQVMPKRKKSAKRPLTADASGSSDKGKDNSSASTSKAKKKSKKTSKASKTTKKKKKDTTSSSSNSKMKRKEKKAKNPKLEPLTAAVSEDDDITAEQAVALQTWQLSEVQSIQQDWDEAVKEKSLSAPKLSKLLAAVPTDVLASFDLVLKLPMKKLPSNWAKVAERVDYIIATAVSFWSAQQPANALEEAENKDE